MRLTLKLPGSSPGGEGARASVPLAVWPRSSRKRTSMPAVSCPARTVTSAAVSRVPEGWKVGALSAKGMGHHAKAGEPPAETV